MDIEKLQEAEQIELIIMNYFNLLKEKIINRDNNKFQESRI
jgi:hypothetical protein